MSYIKGISIHSNEPIPELPCGEYRGVMTAYVVTIPAPGSDGAVEREGIFGCKVTGPALDVELPEGIRGTAEVTLVVLPLAKYELKFHT